MYESQDLVYASRDRWTGTSLKRNHVYEDFNANSTHRYDSQPFSTRQFFSNAHQLLENLKFIWKNVFGWIRFFEISRNCLTTSKFEVFVSIFPMCHFSSQLCSIFSYVYRASFVSLHSFWLVDSFLAKKMNKNQEFSSSLNFDRFPWWSFGWKTQ